MQFDDLFKKAWEDDVKISEEDGLSNLYMLWSYLHLTRLYFRLSLCFI